MCGIRSGCVGNSGSVFNWTMKKAGDVKETAAAISRAGYAAEGWIPATVPGTVLNSLVRNKVYPAPDYGLNNKKTQKLIPDLNKAANLKGGDALVVRGWNAAPQRLAVSL